MIREELDGTTQAVIGADAAHLALAADSSAWERSGVLQTLSRTDRPVRQLWRRALRIN